MNIDESNATWRQKAEKKNRFPCHKKGDADPLFPPPPVDLDMWSQKNREQCRPLKKSLSKTRFPIPIGISGTVKAAMLIHCWSTLRSSCSKINKAMKARLLVLIPFFTSSSRYNLKLCCRSLISRECGEKISIFWIQWISHHCNINNLQTTFFLFHKYQYKGVLFEPYPSTLLPQ